MMGIIIGRPEREMIPWPLSKSRYREKEERKKKIKSQTIEILLQVVKTQEIFPCIKSRAPKLYGPPPIRPHSTNVIHP